MKGLPNEWATITAFVLDERACSNCEQSILYSGIVISTNTGMAPYCIIGVTVVGKAHATVMTSSPRFIRRSPNKGDVKAKNANKLADEPEFVNEQYFEPIHLAKRFSNSSVQGPVVNQKSNDESIKFFISCSSKTRPP